jgi:Ca2+-binding RTX toxin-like protein
VALTPAQGHAATARGAWPTVRDGSVKADTLRGGGRADYLRGHEGPDRLYGKGGDDLLTGDTGGDKIFGGAGNDTLTGAAGGDHLNGDGGADVILGGFGSDHIDGGDGDDTLDGANDSDFIRGGAGNDVIHGGSGPDLLDGGAGDDTLYADSGGDVLAGGDGDDALFVDVTSAAKISCGAGDDTLYLMQAADLPEDFEPPRSKRIADCERTFVTDAVLDPNQGITYLAPDIGGAKAGTTKDDLLLGGPGADTIRAGAGNDVLWGLRQAGLTASTPDILDAGSGDDTIYGGPGAQRIDGGSGNDFINGGVGANTIKAGTGNDTVRLRGSGTSTVDGGAGNDKIYVNGPAAGRVRCGPGTDTAYAGKNDAVAKDCERVVSTAGSKPTRLAPAGTGKRRAATTRAAGAATYADLVRATPGLVHWWRLGDLRTSQYAPTNLLRDEITGVQVTAAYGSFTEPGATDDGDTAWKGTWSVQPGVTDSVFRAPASTIELWVRAGEANPYGNQLLGDWQGWTSADPFQSLQLNLGPDLLPTATISRTDGRSAVLRSTGAALAPGTWHHLALTRDGVTARLYVDGAPADAENDVNTVGTTFSTGWSIGPDGSGSGLTLDEIALYDRALDADTVRAHARVGDDGAAPVTSASPAFRPLLGNGFTTSLSTGKAGSRFRCLVDDVLDIACPEPLVLRNLAAGPHTLKISAVDRFGRAEVSPRTYRFTVDTSVPMTLAALLTGLTGEVPSQLTMGSNDPNATFECYFQQPGDIIVSYDTLKWSPCASGVPVPDDRDRTVLVRAVNASGNHDLTPARFQVKRRADAASLVVPAFGAARADVTVAPEDDIANGLPSLACQLDGAAESACPTTYRLPVLRQGDHVLNVAQTVRGVTDRLRTAPLRFTVGGPTSVTLTALQFPTVIESSASLASRVPRVRLVLDGAARLTMAITGAGDRPVATFQASGTTGPNALKIPAAALRKLTLGRYTLVVTARGLSGAVSLKRLPFAVIPRNR